MGRAFKSESSCRHKSFKMICIVALAMGNCGFFKFTTTTATRRLPDRSAVALRDVELLEQGMTVDQVQSILGPSDSHGSDVLEYKKIGGGRFLILCLPTPETVSVLTSTTLLQSSCVFAVTEQSEHKRLPDLGYYVLPRHLRGILCSRVLGNDEATSAANHMR